MSNRTRAVVGLAGGVCCGISAQFCASRYGPLPELYLACLGLLGMTAVGFVGMVMALDRSRQQVASQNRPQ